MLPRSCIAHSFGKFFTLFCSSFHIPFFVFLVYTFNYTAHGQEKFSDMLAGELSNAHAFWTTLIVLKEWLRPL
jgi:hypothetical protein